MTWHDIFTEKLAEMHVTDLWMLQEDDTLQVKALSPDWKEFVQHRALGRFRCSQCHHKWSSAKVHILFHMWRCPGWGMVWMRVFRQECRRCPNPQLEHPEFSPETMERILHNLVVKILQYFYKKPVQPSDLLEVVVDTPVMGPHDSAHCEACQLGICSKSQRTPASDPRKVMMGANKDRTHQKKSRQAPASDPWKVLMGANKDRTHQKKSRRAPAWVDWKRLIDADESLKLQGLEPHTTSTHHLSLCNSNFPWKRYCCIGSSLLCVLAVIIFVVLYFTRM